MERRKKGTGLYDDGSLNFDSSDFSNVEEYGRWKRGEPFGGYDWGNNQEPEVLRQHFHHPLVNMMAQDPGLIRHSTPNEVGPSQPQVSEPVSALKSAPWHRMQNPTVAVKQASAADRPRPDSMTLPAASQPLLRPCKPTVPVAAKPLNFAAGVGAKKTPASVAEPAKASTKSDKPVDTPKPSIEDVPAEPHPASIETPQVVIQPATAPQAQPQSIAKESPSPLLRSPSRSMRKLPSVVPSGRLKNPKTFLLPRLPRQGH